MKTTIAITGSAGQLGSELARQLGSRAVQLSRAHINLASDASILDALGEIRPAILINCAAYTAVDKAESDAEACFRANAEAVATMTGYCRERNIRLVQLSTDYVFDDYAADNAAGSQRPLDEQTPASPRGIYAQSKLQGEIAAAATPENLIVRTCGLYGGGPTMRNFVETMIRLAATNPELRVVDDQRCTPSYCVDVAAAVLRLIEQEATGLYHVTNRESTTWFELAQTLFSLTRKPTVVQPISTAEYGAAAPRPAYSVLSLEKYSACVQREMPSWRNALERYLNDRKLA
ncbi:dTDP-4-dehydrorhamnose reductase [Blastopirellula marina]|uniref:dTDP-4-dehydrorhamnose reductase n=1 Tax=Blastopirellula marina DSM 3645 TaxID=314230 RepID=A3ZPE6_9BACT|nr:dTDP-4-dehydrorhamnose reductase [Blastopirellula marina]EAQ81624.1 dTDP-4-dehydrorhamnose reductase [Blastopirellula marina DSM 3645]